MPGPGNYGNIDTFGKNAKGFSIQGRMEDKFNENPGPGSYNNSNLSQVRDN